MGAVNRSFLAPVSRPRADDPEQKYPNIRRSDGRADERTTRATFDPEQRPLREGCVAADSERAFAGGAHVYRWGMRHIGASRTIGAGAAAAVGRWLWDQLF